MSVISNGALGTLRGRLGDLNTRVENGRTIISTRPARFKKSNSKKSVENRKNFGSCTKICSAAGKVKVIYHLWKTSGVKGRTVLNKLMSVNSSLVKKSADLNKLVLAPAENYFSSELLSHSIEGSSLKITVPPLPVRPHNGQYRISAQGIMFLSSPLRDDITMEKFIPLTSEIRDIINDELLSFDLQIIGFDEYHEYSTSTFIINLITYNIFGDAEKVSVNLMP